MDNHIRKNHMRSYSNKKCKHFKFTFNRIKRVQNQQTKNHDQSSYTMETPWSAINVTIIFNRPVVAGAVLHTPSWLTN